MYPHDGVNFQTKSQPAKEQRVSMSTSTSENVTDSIDNPHETAGPVTAEPPTPRVGVKEKETEATDPVQAEQNSYRRSAMVTRFGHQVKTRAKLNLSIDKSHC